MFTACEFYSALADVLLVYRLTKKFLTRCESAFGLTLQVLYHLLPL
jgi:hypothetical protein